MNDQRLQKQYSSVTPVIRSMVVDAALGGACAASYGIVFAGFDAAGHGESERMITTIAYFGLCGAIGGGVFGTLSALSNVVEPYKPTDKGAAGCRDIADATVPHCDAALRAERANYTTLASKSHQEQLELRMSRILGPQVPRARKVCQSRFVDRSQWED